MSNEQPLHVSDVMVMQCNKAGCEGTEHGCNGQSCAPQRGFRYWSHQRFEDTYGRCPAACPANKLVKPGNLKARFNPPPKPPAVPGKVAKWKIKK